MPAESPAPYLSVVIPVFNEEINILESIRRVDAFMGFAGWEWELIISNDGSTDRTEFLVKGALNDRTDKRIRLITVEENRGKGAAARRGVLAATGKYILVTDA
ncbi:MAG: glycosyltransferase, partial [Candidatus Omnitrophica bacterium]|nr:glycosyltransferase [Candidatus Omnitrophota bacterium]